MDHQRYRVRDAGQLRDQLEHSQRVVPHSVRSIARIAGLSHVAVAKLLAGQQKTVDAERADRISVALGRSRDDLFVPDASASGDTDGGHDE